jgi:GTP:adenosylcobinamide-phosphate guanylyltransferase
LLRGAASIADEDLALDIDTQEDFDRAQRLLRGA